MNTCANRLMLAGALLAALALGFGLAKLTTAPPAATSGTSQKPAAEAGEDTPGGNGEPGGNGTGEEDLVALTSRQIEAAGIQVVTVGRGGVGHEIRLNGRVEPAIGARAAVAAAINGRVERVLVAPGTGVATGEPLVVMASGEAATMRADVEAARAEAEAARLTYQRDRSLVDQGVVARQDLEASRARSLAADAAARAAAARVGAAGWPDAQGRVTISSPVAGIVGVVRVMPGGFINAGEVVASVTDPVQSELVFSAPPGLAARITPGTRIEVTGPVGSFGAIVMGAATEMREQGGLVIIRARPESGAPPPTGSALTAVVLARDEDDALTVPADAVQTIEGRAVVFVSEDEGFRAVPVLAGRRVGDRIEVLKGLSGDERIAGTKAFLLKAELAKGEAGHGH
ncbi:MAG: efflux RND transporter periplasmic adaptor subunit [Xanthomonadales bacterium]|nr:efflux RND transporter periplasmic adaptor subunit [Xanthomonadales bacterium]